MLPLSTTIIKASDRNNPQLLSPSEVPLACQECQCEIQCALYNVILVLTNAMKMQIELLNGTKIQMISAYNIHKKYQKVYPPIQCHR